MMCVFMGERRDGEGGVKLNVQCPIGKPYKLGKPRSRKARKLEASEAKKTRKPRKAGRAGKAR